MVISSEWDVIAYEFHQDKHNHAEILVLQKFSDVLAEKDDGVKYFLITSLYPCPQCLGKIVHSKIDICVYINFDTNYKPTVIVTEEFGDILPVFKLPSPRGKSQLDEKKKESLTSETIGSLSVKEMHDEAEMFLKNLKLENPNALNVFVGILNYENIDAKTQLQKY
jgi:tRNA(Arg) A34 adenosine deaminase TadA